MAGHDHKDGAHRPMCSGTPIAGRASQIRPAYSIRLTLA